ATYVLSMRTMPDTVVNEHPLLSEPQPIRLQAADFWLLRRSGAFADYSRSELIQGELWGTPVWEDNSGSKYPIRLRIEDYLRLSEAGAFDRYARTELIDGVVYTMNPQHRPHGFAKDELAYRLRRALEAMGSDLHVATEQSVAMTPHDQPEPDIILTTEPRGAGAIPGASVALLVEVAHTSLDHDLLRKAPVYASQGVAEYWVVDVNRGMIHQMWAPAGEAYGKRQRVAFGQRIEGATIEGLAVETAGID
ncbi:MAG TPA: Uma2 family endonuclease, partial [Allosphingosinicella sp.]|nr:Uma2 family endonuclease [Allosphingosinicella sp.]